MKGKVYLVGAGPGDPGLITKKGADLLAAAEVLIYDKLVNPGILNYVSSDCEKIFAGKEGGMHYKTQDETNQLIVEKALEGKNVVRLKGGDPFVFGRGGEEALELKKNNIEFEIVPGVTSAIAAPAYAGIPVTHRHVSTGFMVVTGHEEPGKENSELDWDVMARFNGTLVLLMGVSNLPEIVDKMISCGKAPDTPVALVRYGTWTEQECITGQLDTIADIVSKNNFKPPAVTVIGNVVNLRNDLAWRETMPLFGKRLLITRTREHSSELSKKVIAMGGEAVELPTIKIEALDDYSLLDNALENINSYDGIIFTSHNGAKYFSERLSFFSKDARKLAGCQIISVGAATTRAIKTFLGINADITADENNQEGILAKLKGIASGKKYLFVRALEGRDVLYDGLAEVGADIDLVPAYRTVRPEEDIMQLDRVTELLNAGKINWLLFASASSVNNFISIVGEKVNREKLGLCCVACIGEQTAAAAKESGLTVHVVPDHPDMSLLLQGVLEFDKRS